MWWEGERGGGGAANISGVIDDVLVTGTTMMIYAENDDGDLHTWRKMIMNIVVNRRR